MTFLINKIFLLIETNIRGLTRLGLGLAFVRGAWLLAEYSYLTSNMALQVLGTMLTIGCVVLGALGVISGFNRLTDIRY